MLVKVASVLPTSTGVRDGVDVDVICTVNGWSCEGEVTLAPDHTGRLVAYGQSADMWVSGGLLDWLSSLDEGMPLADLLRDLEGAASRAAERRGR